MEHGARLGQDHSVPQSIDPAQLAWDLPGYTAALGASIEPEQHIAYGQGIRLRLTTGELELDPEHGSVRVANLAAGVEVTLIGQTTPPTVTPEGLVFEGADPTRWLSLGKNGAITLVVDQTGSRETAPEPPVDILSASTDRVLPSPARPTVQADAAPTPTRQPESKEQARGRVDGILVSNPVFVVTSQKQKELVRFTVAEHYTDADGQPQTVYHKCVAFNSERKRLADQVRDQGHQGDRIVVHGNWHDVTVYLRNGTSKDERQLWAYGLKITPQTGQS